MSYFPKDLVRLIQSYLLPDEEKIRYLFNRNIEELNNINQIEMRDSQIVCNIGMLIPNNEFERNMNIIMSKSLNNVVLYKMYCHMFKKYNYHFLYITETSPSKKIFRVVMFQLSKTYELSRNYIKCECGVIIKKGHFKRHLKAKLHKNPLTDKEKKMKLRHDDFFCDEFERQQFLKKYYKLFI